jgi:hypothetical protein
MSMDTPFGSDRDDTDSEPAGRVENGDEIDRGETGVRALMALLFLIIIQVVEAVLTVVVLFELAFAAITRRPPSDTVKRFAMSVTAYGVEIVRYLTYNDDSAPFPFRDLPTSDDDR